MNDVTFVEAARVLAQRAIMAQKHPDGRIAYTFRRILARAPRPSEVERLRASLSYYLDRYRGQPAEAEKFVGVGDAARPESVPAPELAAYTAITSLLFNLDEAVTKE